MARISENANGIIEAELDCHLEQLETEIGADVIAYLGPLRYGADDVIREEVEGRKDRRHRLAVLLETSGGYIEVVQRIVEVLRKHYGYVEFVIPNYAMSAGTVLVMSGDAIRMDYYSILGPIDPQVQRPSGSVVPALGYLAQYERLIEKSRKGKLTTAEMTFLVEKFDPAELYRYEQARNLSISLLKEWLAKYKFKNWTVTKTRQRKVTPAMRTRRAAEIAKMLNDTGLWHSHGRGISMETLRRDLRLEIEDFGANNSLSQKIRIYYKLLLDYMAKRSHTGVFHTKGRYVSLAG